MHGALVRKALSVGNPVDQPVANISIPYPVLTFNQVIYDTDSSFDPSDSSFVVPAGMNFARVWAQVVWTYNVTGLRQLVILRKSPLNVDATRYEFFTADPVSTQLASSETTTDQSTQGVFPVVPGEHYAVFPMQSSGGPLTISGGTGTVFSIQFWQ